MCCDHVRYSADEKKNVNKVTFWRKKNIQMNCWFVYSVCHMCFVKLHF